MSHKHFINPRGILIKQRTCECIFHLLLGKTIKEIAYALKISHRTVEEELYALKKEFKCNSKSQIISKLLKIHANKEIIISFLINETFSS